MLRHVGEIVFKIAITAGVLVAIAYQFALVIGIWNQRVDPVQTLRNVITRQLKPEWVAIRESTRIYQSRQPVGIVIGEVTRSDNQVIFEWMVDVASFNQSEPFEVIVGLGLAMQHTRSSHDPVSCCPSLRLMVE